MTIIRHRRGTKNQWAAANPVLLAGEPAYETDTGRQKIGNGGTAWNLLPYADEVGSSVGEGSVADAFRPLQEQFAGVRPGTRVPATKAEVILGVGDNTYGDYDTLNGTAYSPPQMYDKAVVNWSSDTLSAYGAAFINFQKAHAVGTSFEFTTILEGDHMLVAAYKLSGLPIDWRVWIDDEEVTQWKRGNRTTNTSHTGPIMRYDGPNNVDSTLSIYFEERGIHKIRVAGPGISGVYGLMFTNPGGKLHRPGSQKVLGVISDSWYDSITYHTSLNAATELAARMGWNCWNMAVGGTGFVNPGAEPSTPCHYGSNAVFEALEKAPDLDLLLLNGSVNDIGYPQAEVLSAMEAFFTRWRQVRPQTPIVWQGLEPQSYFEGIFGEQTIVDREAAQRDVALADESVIGVIESAKEQWLTGTGNTGAPSGGGNQDWVIGTDAVHLSPWGTYWNGALVHDRLAPMKTWRS